MTDPMEEAMAAQLRTIQHLDQQLAAARDANGRLTARVVELEITVRNGMTALREARDKHDEVSEMLMNARDELVTRMHRITDLQDEARKLAKHVHHLETLLATYQD